MKKYSKFLLALLMVANTNIRSLNEQNSSLSVDDQNKVVGSVKFEFNKENKQDLETYNRFKNSFSYTAISSLVGQIGESILWVDNTDRIKSELRSLTEKLDSEFVFNPINQAGKVKSLQESCEELKGAIKNYKEAISKLPNNIEKFDFQYGVVEENNKIIFKVKVKDNKYEKILGYLDLNNLIDHQIHLVRKGDKIFGLEFSLKTYENDQVINNSDKKNTKIGVKFYINDDPALVQNINFDDSEECIKKSILNLFPRIIKSELIQFQLRFCLGKFFYYEDGSEKSTLLSPLCPYRQGILAQTPLLASVYFKNNEQKTKLVFSSSSDKGVLYDNNIDYTREYERKVILPYQNGVTIELENNKIKNENMLDSSRENASFSKAPSTRVQDFSHEPLTEANEVSVQPQQNSTVLHKIEKTDESKVTNLLDAFQQKNEKQKKPYKDEKTIVKELDSLTKKVKNSNKEKIKSGIKNIEDKINKFNNMPENKKTGEQKKVLKELNLLGGKMEKMNNELECIKERSKGYETPNISQKFQTLTSLINEFLPLNSEINKLKNKVENSSNDGFVHPLTTQPKTVLTPSAIPSERRIKATKAKCGC